MQYSLVLCLGGGLSGSIHDLTAVKRLYCFLLLGEDKGTEVHPIFLNAFN